MDERAFIQYIEQRDRDSVTERVERWRSIAPAAYQYLPRLLWDYLTEMDKMYIGGHFIGVILFCAAVIEGVLRDQVSRKGLVSKEDLERLEFWPLSVLAVALGVISHEEKATLDEVRRARNNLIHFDAKGLNGMAKKVYNSSLQAVKAEMWWTWEAPEKALQFLTFTRDLTVKYYGIKEHDV